MPHPPPTERLLFRELANTDIENLQLIFSDPVAMAHYPSTKDIKATQEWIDWTLRNYQRCGHGLWAVCLANSGEFIGQCGLVPQNIRDRDEVEIGYLFRRSHWGRGYATEAASACRDYGFRHLAVEKLVSFIGPKNEQSKKVALQIGMTLECVLSPAENRWEKEVHVFSIHRPESKITPSVSP